LRRLDEGIFKLNKQWNEKLENETSKIYGNIQEIRNTSKTDEEKLRINKAISELIR
jgi:hypothetical protein